MLNQVKHIPLNDIKRKFPFVVGKIYHVYNQGVAKCLICREDADFWRFLQGLCLFNDAKSVTNILWQIQRNRGRLTLNTLKDYIVIEGEKREKLVRILAYCVLGNHYHLLIEEIKEGGITQFMHKLGLGYASYFNNKYERVGSLYRDKFKSIPVDDELYLQYLLVYINVLNPLGVKNPNWKEEGIKDIESTLEDLKYYLWSTHHEYAGLRNSLIIEKGAFEEILPIPDDYLNLVKNVLVDKKYQEIENLILE